MTLEVDPAADVLPAAAAAGDAPASAARQRRGWWLRRAYAPVEEAEQGTAPRADAVEEKGDGNKKPPRRGGWVRRLVSREYALGGRRRWKLSGATSRLAAGLRWKRVSSGLGEGGCAAAVLDTVTFRVMYVVEAVVLGLALSCFFCCCGCQI
ncbi:hypothetical protein QOZ80_1BG0077930 [Eleusine coracana subsp. coracana]|nr:hypothetical protein QOZ80_1BG0077930 [Eleusine coracana subsp. coracana]